MNVHVAIGYVDVAKVTALISANNVAMGGANLAAFRHAWM
jgi:hypothetical protein